MEQEEPILVPESDLEIALQGGALRLKPGQRVSVISPDGEGGTLPSEQVKEALELGYQIDNPLKRSVREYVAENDNLAGKAKVALGQFADEALFGAPEIALDYTQTPLEREKREALKKKHETYNTLGGLAGFGANLVVGGPLFKAASKLSAPAAEAVASTLRKAGIDEGSKRIASQIVAKTAKNATRMGVEGAVLAAPRAVTEAALGDPQAAAESLLAGIGFGAVFGAAIGGVPAVTGPLWAKMKGVTKAIASGGDDAAQGLDQSLVEILGRRKKNEKEIREAFAKLGVEAPEGAISDNRLIRSIDDRLRKSPSSTGIKREAQYAKILDTTEEALRKNLVDPDTKLSRLEAGDIARASIINAVKARSQPLDDAYRMIKETANGIALEDPTKKAFLQSIDEMVTKSNTPYADKVRRYASDLMEAQNVEQLEARLSIVKDDISELFRRGRDSERLAVKALKDKVDELVENKVTRQAKLLKTQGVGEASQLADDFLRLKEETKKNYATYMNFLDTLRGVAKVRGKTTFRFIDGIEDDIAISSERLIDRLLDKKNARALDFLKKEVPDAYQTVVTWAKNDMISRHTVDGQLKLGAFFNEVKRLSPEMRRLMFGEQADEVVKAARVVFESLPPNVNPSNSAPAYSLNFFNPVELVKYGSREASDRMQLFFVRRAVNRDGIFLADDAIRSTDSRIQEGVNRVRALGGRLLPQADPSVTSLRAFDSLTRDVSDLEERSERAAKVREKLSEILTVPERLAEFLSEFAKPISLGGAPDVGASFMGTIQRAFDYLQKVAPKQNNFQSGLFQEPKTQKISDVELSKFERKLSVIDDPFMVFDALDDNTLTKEHLEALAAVYPTIYMGIKNRVRDMLMDERPQMPYQRRLKLSMLLNDDAEPSVRPEYVRTFQKSFIKADQGTTPSVNPSVQVRSIDGYKTPSQRRLT